MQTLRFISSVSGWIQNMCPLSASISLV